MPRFTPVSLRQQVVEAVERGEGTHAELAERFGVGRRTITTWLALKKRTGSVEPKQGVRWGPKPLLTEDDRRWLRERVKAQPEISLKTLRREVAEQLGKQVAENTIDRALNKMGLHSRHSKRASARMTAASSDKVVSEALPEEPKATFRYQRAHRETVEGNRAGYPSDLTDAQWALIAPLLAPEHHLGRPWDVERRRIVDALMYIARTGCQWRYLPHDFPPWNLVAKTFYRWKESGVWEKVNEVLREKARVSVGKNPRPTAGMLDSQSVKTTEKGGLADTTEARRSKDASVISS